ncbi:MAG: molybdopterin cofactor-binding domain-containing protein [Bacteroidota bacterium]|jgi:isoquinoline 1-oxidoreductase
MKEHPDVELVEISTVSGSGMNRRQFLKLTGGGIFLFFTIGDLEALAQRRQGRSLPSDFNAFLKIGEDGRVSCYTGKIEMGQGVSTSLAQMLADELDVAVDSVDMVMGDTDLCPWDMGTFGSMTTRFFGPALRSAGAEARGVLIQLASEHLGIPEKNLTTENGAVFETRNVQKKVTYAELAAGKKIERHLSEKPPVKKLSQFKVMTKPLVRADGRDKVTGKARYAGDIQLPGMLYARILRPPAHGSKLIDVDLSDAKAMEGLQVIQDGEFVAVLHKYPDLAELGLSKIKPKFDKPQSDLDDKNIFDHLLKVAPEGNVVAKEGDLEKGEHDATSIVEETYLDGYKAHAPIEPHAAVVNIEGNKATVWSSSQTPFSLKEEVAKELGCAPENVHVISPFLGGAFGGKSRNQQVVEAARLAKRTGKPVQVAWTRKEEFFYDSFRPAAIVKVKSGITDNGRICLWDYHVYYAGERGAQQFYNIPHHATTVHNSSWVGAPGSHPFSTGPWRAPGNSTNTFARESQIDIMASKAQVDPLEFRIRNLEDKKMQRVLTTAAGKFGWKPAKAPSGRGYGIACGMDAGSYVAAFAEVEVDKATGNVQVKRVVCAQDMGLAINPEGAAIQVEGCITMGLGYALREHIRFRAGEIFDLNFDSYEIPRFSWLPEIETIIIEDNQSDPQGGGEPAIITMGAVVANAVFDATGIRLFELPLSPEKIKEAIKKG